MITEKIFIISLWFFAAAATFQSCLEGHGHGLDPNGYCHPVDSFTLSICPELCNPRNKEHVCYCDTTDINDTCLACDVTVPTTPCYDSCRIKAPDPANPGKLILKDTCKKEPGAIAAGECRKDPMNPCAPECASLRNIDYATRIAPIWKNNKCLSCHHLTGSAANTTGGRRPYTIIYGSDTVNTVRLLSLKPDNNPKLNPLSMLINVPTFEDSTNHPLWRVRPFAPDSSYLYTILKGPMGKAGKPMMPSGEDPIPPASLADIKQWIEEGACPE
jgi:hypothetical protein